jgi:hypothetical protein
MLPILAYLITDNKTQFLTVLFIPATIFNDKKQYSIITQKLY